MVTIETKGFTQKSRDTICLFETESDSNTNIFSINIYHSFCFPSHDFVWFLAERLYHEARKLRVLIFSWNVAQSKFLVILRFELSHYMDCGHLILNKLNIYDEKTTHIFCKVKQTYFTNAVIGNGRKLKEWKVVGLLTWFNHKAFVLCSLAL